MQLPEVLLRHIMHGVITPQNARRRMRQSRRCAIYCRAASSPRYTLQGSAPAEDASIDACASRSVVSTCKPIAKGATDEAEPSPRPHGAALRCERATRDSHPQVRRECRGGGAWKAVHIQSSVGCGHAGRTAVRPRCQKPKRPDMVTVRVAPDCAQLLRARNVRVWHSLVMWDF